MGRSEKTAGLGRKQLEDESEFETASNTVEASLEINGSFTLRT